MSLHDRAKIRRLVPWRAQIRKSTRPCPARRTASRRADRASSAETNKKRRVSPLILFCSNEKSARNMRLVFLKWHFLQRQAEPPRARAPATRTASPMRRPRSSSLVPVCWSSPIGQPIKIPIFFRFLPLSFRSRYTLHYLVLLLAPVGVPTAAACVKAAVVKKPGSELPRRAVLIVSSSFSSSR